MDSLPAPEHLGLSCSKLHDIQAEFFFPLYQKWFIYYLSDVHPILLNYTQLYMFGFFTFYSLMLFVTTVTSQKVKIKNIFFLFSLQHYQLLQGFT